jgi:transcriptional antiterminator RfaH
MAMKNENDMTWYVLYTKTKAEIKTANLLSQKGIIVYCPVQTVVKQWTDRKKKVIEPIFRSFIFVALNDYHKEQVEVLTTPGSVNFLWYLSKPAVVKHNEIETIKEYLEGCENIKLYETASYQKGIKVRISKGILEGHEAMITSIHGNKCFLEIKSLGFRLVADKPIFELLPSYK